MKNNFIYFGLFILLFTGCNKQKSVVKNLTGVWNIHAYTYQNFDGLSYKYDSDGTFRFDNCSNEYCAYELNMSYISAGQNQSKNDVGEYKVENDGEHFTLKRVNSDGTISLFSNNRILLINKDQMKMLFQDEIGIHHFILEK